MRFLPLLLLSLVLAACARDDAAPTADRRPEPTLPGAAKTPAPETGAAEHFRLEPVADGFNRPVWAGAAPGDDRIWVAEQPGRLLRIDKNGDPQLVLDLSDKVEVGAEQGFLGVAFHPGFATGDPFLYVHYSAAGSGDTRVVEYRVGKTIRRLRTILRVEQPEENHNGGQLAFGPDGRLYIGLGDGGGAFDQDRLAQDLDTRLGKLLVTDVAARRPRWETVLYGLRNPWRFSFDFGLNEIWIGDVGQNRFEEIDRVLLEPDVPPKNLGWSAYEGTLRLPGSDIEGDGELLFPVAQYSHDDGCSVTGGVVYRGTDVPALAGRYVYGDFCTGILWTLEPRPGGGALDLKREQASLPQLTHIGTDDRGELLLVSAAGGIYRAS